MNTLQKTVSALSLASLVLLTGCQTNNVKPAPKPTAISCNLPVSKDLGRATTEAQNMLSHPSCAFQFNNTFKELLVIGEGQPGKSNAKIFGDFLRWSKALGIVSEMQMIKLYSTYFSTTFSTLPGDHQSCYYCNTQGIDKMFANVDQELLSKQQGMVRVMKDKALYQKASFKGEAIKLRMEAVCVACGSTQ